MKTIVNRTFSNYEIWKLIDGNGNKQFSLFPMTKTEAKGYLRAKSRADWTMEKFEETDWNELEVYLKEEEERSRRPAEWWELAGYNANPDKVVWQFEE
jgi:hypothetical protein